MLLWAPELGEARLAHRLGTGAHCAACDLRRLGNTRGPRNHAISFDTYALVYMSIAVLWPAIVDARAVRPPHVAQQQLSNCFRVRQVSDCVFRRSLPRQGAMNTAGETTNTFVWHKLPQTSLRFPNPYTLGYNRRRRVAWLRCGNPVIYQGKIY